MPDALKALIFDVDGTLAETEEAHRQAFNRAFAEARLPWQWDAALYGELLQVSGGKERIRAFVQDHDPARDTPALDGLIARLHKRKTELYTAFVAGGDVPFRPGVARLINEARALGLRLAVATTTTTANVTALLDGATGGAGHAWFEVMACAEDAPAKKPDPLVYKVVLERLGLRPHQCLALEDSRNGVRAARAAGVPVVVSRSAYTQDDDVSGALRVYPDFETVTLEELRRLYAGMRYA